MEFDRLRARWHDETWRTYVEQPRSGLRSDKLRQEVSGREAGVQAQPRKVEAELGRARRDAHVGRDCQTQTRAHRSAVDGYGAARAASSQRRASQGAKRRAALHHTPEITGTGRRLTDKKRP